MTEPSVSFAGNLTDDPELRHTEGGIARAMFRVAVSGRREQEVSFFTVVVWRDQAEHAAQSLSKGSRIVVVGRLQQRSWTAEDGSARSTVEVLADELGPSLRWATATTTRATRSQASSQLDQRRGGAGRGPSSILAFRSVVSAAPPAVSPWSQFVRAATDGCPFDQSERHSAPNYI
jgi:single-strand DNA-binding protein